MSILIRERGGRGGGRGKKGLFLQQNAKRHCTVKGAGWAADGKLPLCKHHDKAWVRQEFSADEEQDISMVSSISL